MTKNVLDYDAAPDCLAAVIESLRAAFLPRPYVIGVAAPSAAGKGHLIGKLLERLDGGGIGILDLDRYYRGRTAMIEDGVSSFDDPRALDLARAADDIKALKAGKTASVPIYDFPSGERTGYEPFGPVGLLIVDGLFALREPIRSRLDYKVFIETDPHSAFLRRLFRDAGLSGRTKQSSRDVIDQYFREVLPAQREHIDPTKAAADLVVASRYDAKKEADRPDCGNISSRSPAGLTKNSSGPSAPNASARWSTKTRTSSPSTVRLTARSSASASRTA